MSESGSLPQNAALQFDAGTKSDLIDATDNEITGLTKGKVYRVSACSGSAICKWGTTEATVSVFDFIVPRDTSIIVRATDTALSIKESDTSSDAAARLYVQPIDLAAM